jgi:uncharacterized protein (DUF4213/DUF364 family)
MSNLPNPSPLATDLLLQMETLATRFTPPRVTRLHIPADAPGDASGPKDAKFCAIELDDGAFGLSYILLGDTLDALTGAHAGTAASPLAGADPLRLARRFAHGGMVERAVALAAINALTDSVWRQVGYAPPAARNSLGDVQLGATDHLGMIGFFPPLVRQVQALGGRLSVLELDEAMVRRQRERFPGVHITLERAALLPCNKVVGTSTMLLNDTLDAMLAAAPQAQAFAVIGPSAGLWPDALFARGVTLLGGTRVRDGAAFADAMARGESWSAASRKFAIDRASWPGWERLLA